MSTFDNSNEPPEIVPSPPAPGTPTTAGPEARVGVKSVLPLSCSPSWLAKFAKANSPSACVLPLVNEPVMVPFDPIVKLASDPLELPSCAIDVVVLGAATWVITGVVPLSTFQLKVWLEAPSAKPVM